MAANDHKDAITMFEYLREDIKELGAKMDRNNDMLSKHITDDAQNFSHMDQRLTAIEATQKTKDQISEKSAGLRAWLIPLIVTSVFALIAALITKT